VHGAEDTRWLEELQRLSGDPCGSASRLAPRQTSGQVIGIGGMPAESDANCGLPQVPTTRPRAKYDATDRGGTTMAAWVSYQRLDNGDIHIRWSDVQQLLGRPYRGDDADDSRIVEFLRRDVGLPEWIEEAEGYQDRLGWYLKSPVQFDRAADAGAEWGGRRGQPGVRRSGRSRLAAALRAPQDLQSNRRAARLRAVVGAGPRQPDTTHPDLEPTRPFSRAA